MMTGGPIVEYFKHWAPEHGNTLCFVGYQASGTLGRRLQDGHSQVPLMDRGQTLMIAVNCNMVIIDGFQWPLRQEPIDGLRICAYTLHPGK